MISEDSEKEIESLYNKLKVKRNKKIIDKKISSNSECESENSENLKNMSKIHKSKSIKKEKKQTNLSYNNIEEINNKRPNDVKNKSSLEIKKPISKFSKLKIATNEKRGIKLDQQINCKKASSSNEKRKGSIDEQPSEIKTNILPIKFAKKGQRKPIIPSKLESNDINLEEIEIKEQEIKSVINSKSSKIKSLSQQKFLSDDENRVDKLKLIDNKIPPKDVNEPDKEMFIDLVVDKDKEEFYKLINGDNNKKCKKKSTLKNNSISKGDQLISKDSLIVNPKSSRQLNKPNYEDGKVNDFDIVVRETKVKQTRSKTKENVKIIREFKSFPRDLYFSSPETKLYTDCCVSCNNRNVIRALETSNLKLLETCIESKDLISDILVEWSIESQINSFTIAVIKRNKDILTVLINYFINPTLQTGRVSYPISQLQYVSSGNNSFHTFGRYTKKVNMTRGGKLGNNAFIQNEEDLELHKEIANSFIKHCHDDKLLECLYSVPFSQEMNNIKKNRAIDIETDSTLEFLVYRAINYGNRLVANYFINKLFNKDDFGFNVLHETVLTNKDGNFPIKYRPSVNKKSRFSVTPVHFACINENVKVLENLLENSGDINFLDDFAKKPIHYASVCIGPEPLKLLLKKGANVNDRDKDKFSPLLYAAKTGRLENIKVLLENGADLNYKIKNSAIHLAALEGHNHVVKYLIEEMKISVNLIGEDKLTLLHIACMKGNEELVKYLLLYENININAKDKLSRTPFLISIKAGFYRISTLLSENFSKLDVNITDNSGNSALHYACAFGWIDCVKLLLSKGANLLAENSWKSTPFEISILKKHLGIINYCIKSPNFDINTKFGNGTNLLLQYFMNINPKSIDLIENLILNYKADATCFDFNKNTPLHFLCRFTYNKYISIYHPYQNTKFVEYVKSNKDIMEKITKLHKKTPVNNTNDQFNPPTNSLLVENNTSLFGAKSNNLFGAGSNNLFGAGSNNLFGGGMNSFASPLSFNFKPNSTNSLIQGNLADSNDSKAQLLINNEIANMAYKLYQKHLERNFDRYTGEYKILMSDLFNLLIENSSNVNFINKEKETPLFASIYNNNSIMVKLLLGRGANVNIMNRVGTTPLLMSIKMDILLVEMLLRYNADANLKSKQGDLPLFESIANKNEKLIELLLKNHANPNEINQNGDTPLLFALKMNIKTDELTRMISLLVKFNSNVNHPNKEGDTPLFLAFKHGKDELVNLLIDNGANVNFPNNEGQSPVFVCLNLNKIPLVNKLIENGADILYVNKKNENILHLLADKIFDIDFIEIWKTTIFRLAQIKSNGKLNLSFINIVDEFGFTPLIRIFFTLNEKISNHFMEIIKEAITNKCLDKWDFKTIDYRICNYLTVNEQEEILNNVKMKLINFISSVIIPIINSLIELGADPFSVVQIKDSLKLQRIKEEKEKAALEKFNKSRKKNNKLEIIENEPITLNSFQKQFGYTNCLMFAMCFPIKELLKIFTEKQKLNLNCLDFLNKNCLMYLLQNEFIQRDFPEIFREALIYLVGAGININNPDSDLNTAFSVCAKKFLTDEMTFLFNHGADINFFDNKGENPFFTFVKLNNLDKVKYMVENFKYNFNSIDKFLRTPLHYIMLKDDVNKDVDVKMLKYFLCNKANPNMKDFKGRTPIFYLFIKDNEYETKCIDPIATLTFLIESSNVDLNVQDVYGNSVIFYAIQRKASICFSTLINKGATLNIKNVENNYPIGYNILMCANNISEILTKGADLNVLIYPLKKREFTYSKYLELQKPIVSETDDDEINVDENEDQEEEIEDNIQEIKEDDFIIEDEEIQEKIQIEQDIEELYQLPIKEILYEVYSTDNFNNINKDEQFDFIPDIEEVKKEEIMIIDVNEQKNGVKLQFINNIIYDIDNKISCKINRTINSNSCFYNWIFENRNNFNNDLANLENDYFDCSFKIFNRIKSIFADYKRELKNEKYVDIEEQELKQMVYVKKQRDELEKKSKKLRKARLIVKEKKEEERNFKYINVSLFKACVILGQQGLIYLLLNNGYDLIKAISEVLEEKKFNLSTLLLAKNTNDELYKKDYLEGMNLIHSFAINSLNESNLFEIFNILFMKQINIDSPDFKGFLPFHYACKKHNFPLINLLISYSGIDINSLFLIRTNNHDTAFKLFFINFNAEDLNIIDKIESLIVSLNTEFYEKLQDNKGNYPLHLACKFLSPQFIQKVINSCPNYLNILERKNSAGYTPLYYCFKRSSVKLIEMIIKNMSQIQFHTPDKNMNLPIHLSCRVFNGDVIKEILNNVKESDRMLAAKDSSQFKVFDYIVTNWNANFIEYYLSKISVSTLAETDLKGNTIFHHLFAKLDKTLLRSAYSKFPNLRGNYFEQNNQGLYPLSNCFALIPTELKSNIRIIHILVKEFIIATNLNKKCILDNLSSIYKDHTRNISKNFKEDVFTTPLNKLTEVLINIVKDKKEVIPRKKNVNLQISNINNNYYYNEFIELIGLLIENGVSLSEKNTNGEDCLLMAVKDNNLELFSFLCENPKANIKFDTIYEKGRSLIHYIVQPFYLGTYGNIDMLLIALKKGFIYDIRDINNIKPIDLAAKQLTSGFFDILYNYDKDFTFKSITNLDINMETLHLNYDEDAEKYYTICDENEKEEFPIDSVSGYDSKTHTLVKHNCDNFSHMYDVTLTKVRVGRNIFGEYLFYKMQIILDKLKDVFILWNRWGRIGEDGAYQRTPFINLAEAEGEFKKVFKSKTGNDWNTTCNNGNKQFKLGYSRRNGKYILIEYKNKKLKHSQLLKEFSFKSAPASTLSKSLQRFIYNISKTSLLFRQFYSSNQIDSEVLAFASIRKNLISDAKVYLEKLKGKIVEIQEIRAELMKSMTIKTEIEDMRSKTNALNQKLVECSQKIYDYTSRFYELVPKKGYEQTKIVPLDNLNSIENELNFIEQLVYVEKTCKILLGALYRQNEINPLDYCYNSISCQMRKLPFESPEYKCLKEYIQMSHKVVNFEKVFNIYSVDRKEENLDKYKNTPNHFLLFHGTKIFNMLGILAHVN